MQYKNHQKDKNEFYIHNPPQIKRSLSIVGGEIINKVWRIAGGGAGVDSGEGRGRGW